MENNHREEGTGNGERGTGNGEWGILIELLFDFLNKTTYCSLFPVPSSLLS